MSTLVESMHKIRQLSKKMLEEKLRESSHVSDMDAKRDIMSILVRARKAEQEGNTANYTMNDQAMMDQVVRGSPSTAEVIKHLATDSSLFLVLVTKLPLQV